MPANDYPLPPRQQRNASYISSLIRWLQLKNYQYEVTFSLYMLTRTEKLIFNVIIMILFSLLVTAASMYLPDHVAQIYTRLWYYVHGAGAGAGAGAVGKTTLEAVVKSTTEVVASQTARAAQEAVRRVGEL